MLFNTSDVSCATDQLVLTLEQAKQFEKLDCLIDEINQLRENEHDHIKSAKENGFDQGYKEGLNVSRKEMNLLFSEYLESITRRVIEEHTLSQQDILELALNITRKIALEIGSEDMIAGIAQRAIKNLKTEKPLEIKVNAEIATTVEQKLSDRKAMNNNGIPINIEVVPDPNIGTLDCIITSDSGVTEASFEQQLKLLEQQLNRVSQGSAINA
jgi:flagellar biosynthesis/type III secretory pathway protein FliH